MGVVTVESSYQSSNPDMGSSHIQIHSRQHNFLQDGEPLIEEITNTNLNDDGIDLAIKKAQDLGVRDENEWAQYNKGLRKNRRKDSYMDYIASLGSNTIKGKKRQLNSKKTSAQTRNKIRRELSYIEQNKGVPIYSTLYYVGSVADYDGKSQEEIKELRKAKAETLKQFFNSKCFKELHRGLSRLEIHYDERGDIHGQGQEVFVHTDRRGRTEFSQRAMIKNSLIKRYGSEDELNRRLNLLCFAHEYTDKNKSVGDVRADYKYLTLALRNKYVKPEHAKKFSAGERTTRLIELARIEDIFWLNKTAEKVYKQHGLKWEYNAKYATNGEHLTASQYTKKHNLDSESKKIEKSLDIQRKELHDNENKLRQQRQEMAEIQARQKQLGAQKAHQERVEKQQHATQSALTIRKQELDVRESKLNETVNEIKTDFVGWLQKRGHKIIADMMEKAFDRLVKLQNQKKRQRILDEQAQQQANDMAVQFITESKQADVMAPTFHEQRKAAPYRDFIDNAYDNQLPSHQIAKKRPMTLTERITKEIVDAGKQRKEKEKDKPKDTGKDNEFTL